MIFIVNYTSIKPGGNKIIIDIVELIPIIFLLFSISCCFSIFIFLFFFVFYSFSAFFGINRRVLVLIKYFCFSPLWKYQSYFFFLLFLFFLSGCLWVCSIHLQLIHILFLITLLLSLGVRDYSFLWCSWFVPPDIWEPHWCGGKVCVLAGGGGMEKHAIILWLDLSLLVNLCLWTVNFTYYSVFVPSFTGNGKAGGSWCCIFSFLWVC